MKVTNGPALASLPWALAERCTGGAPSWWPAQRLGTGALLAPRPAGGRTPSPGCSVVGDPGL